MESYGNEIESYLKRGIQVEYLMLDREHAFSLDRDYYQKKEQETAEALDRTLRKLEKLSQYENLQIRIALFIFPIRHSLSGNMKYFSKFLLGQRLFFSYF